MQVDFIFPISEIRNSIELNNGRKYYAITLANGVEYHAKIKMKHICNGERIELIPSDLRSYTIKLNTGYIRPTPDETVYALVKNLLFEYKILKDSYLHVKRNKTGLHRGMEFGLKQVYKIDESKFNGLILLGKEKDTSLASKLIGTEYVTELMYVDFA